MTAVVSTQGQQLMLDFDTDATQRDLAVSQPVSIIGSITGSVTLSYRVAALAITQSDTLRAWARMEIFKLALERRLVAAPGNLPILHVALRQLVRRGKVRKVAKGYYRAASDAGQESSS